MSKKGFWAVILAVLAAGAASAQVTVSGGFALSYMDAKESGTSYSVKGDIGLGGNIYMDYLLPIGIPLSLGGEAGIDSSSFTQNGAGYSFTDTVLAIPLLLRAAYHFDVHPKLDLYLVGKIGVAFGFWSGDNYNLLKSAGVSIDTPFGVGFGADVGIAYYFMPNFGLFAEGGFDAYSLKAELSGGGVTSTLEAPFYRFLTVGVSLKF
jgi:hypothetical protein